MEITDKSHNAAWTKAEQSAETEMSYLDIAESAEASPELLKYIALQVENHNLRIT